MHGKDSKVKEERTLSESDRIWTTQEGAEVMIPSHKK